MSGRDEFYVGYADRAPPALGRWLRVRVALIVTVATVVAATLAAVHVAYGPGVFEYLETREFSGRIRAEPQPILEVGRPGDGAGVSRYLLVAPGKHGAGPLVREHDGRLVRVEGLLVHRDGRTMIELVPGSFVVVESAGIVPPGEPEELGELTLTGEIVDSKCFLGVMNPGHLKTHRACAARCISGGVPPLLHVRLEGGAARQLLLVGRDGSSLNGDLLDLVAEPVEVSGRATRHGDLLVLWADRESFRRVP